MAQLNHEPSMEDILASIKRIIAEDSEAAAPRAARQIRREVASIQPPVEPARVAVAMDAGFEPAPPKIDAAPEVEPVLDTPHAIEPVPDAVVAVDEEVSLPVEAHAEADTADVLELTSPLTEDVPEPAPAPVEAAQPKPIRPRPIQSRPTPSESVEPIQPPREPVAIMDRLMSDNAASASRTAFAALTQLQVRAEAGQENTLEGLVSDLIRPMLREWLDRELPAMVERMVAAEIGRVSGRA